MMSTNNIFSPANGAPIISPSQDVVMGCYYLTVSLPDRKGEGMMFSSLDEVQLAYSLGKVDTHARIKVKLPPHRTTEERRRVEQQARRHHRHHGRPRDVQHHPARGHAVLQHPDALERSGQGDFRLLPDLGPPGDDRSARRYEPIGFRESTRSGLSFATDDLITPPAKPRIIGEAEKRSAQAQQAVSARHHHRGRALQPGARRLDARPRADHRGNDGRAWKTTTAAPAT